MRRKFLVNISFLLLLNLLIKPLWIFGIDVQVQNTVGPQGYGFYFALFNFAFLFNMILDFGIANFNQRLVARKAERIADYLPNILLIKLLLGGIYYLLVYVIALLLGFESSQLQLLFWIALNRVLLSFLLYFRSNVSGMQHFRTDAVLSITDRALMILFCGLLLFGNVLDRPFEIADFVYAQTAALTVAALLGFVALRYHHGKLRLAWNRRLFITVIKKSYPFALLGLLMSLYNRLDGVMIERIADNGNLEAGIYAAAYRLLDALAMFGFLFATILLPMFSRMFKEREPVGTLLKQSFQLIAVLSLTAAIIGWFFRAPIMDLLYTDSNAYYAKNFGLLILGFPLIASVYIFGTLLTAAGRLKSLNAIAIGGLILNVGMNIWLIPQHGAYGAVIATILTQLLVAILHAVVVARNFNFKIPVDVVARTGLFTALTAGITYGMLQVPIPLLVQITIIGLIALGLAFVLKMIDIRGFNKFAP